MIFKIKSQAIIMLNHPQLVEMFKGIDPQLIIEDTTRKNTNHAEKPKGLKDKNFDFSYLDTQDNRHQAQK